MKTPPKKSFFCFRRFAFSFVAFAVTHNLVPAQDHWNLSEEAHRRSRLSGEAIPLQLETFPSRNGPFIEIGENFLGPGNLQGGFQIPGGAVWQPYFIVFGSLRTAVQSFGRSKAPVQEWSNRLDLFGNLYLTFTERILIGIRPLDEKGMFTNYTFRGGPKEFKDQLNAEITTLFFEGDFGELFPDLDPFDRHGLDFGLSVGRQFVSFQEGVLINDNIDAAGITRINMKWFGAINFRWSLMYGWNKINRLSASLNVEDKDAQLVALLTELDTRASTVAFDVIYVDAKNSTGDGIYAGLSSVSRLGSTNATFRLVGSYPIGTETDYNRSGALFMTQLGWSPLRTHNFLYLNLFAGLDRYRSAARDPGVGGPLAPSAGVLFSGAGLGRFGSALTTFADNVVGSSLGYQLFFASNRQQLVFELGGRYGYKDTGQSAAAVGMRYQVALGQRFLVQIDGAGGYVFLVNNVKPADQMLYGARFEIAVSL
ncbi:MAG TPA: hypothetical protein VGB89_16895 [Bacteroidota bacterium]